MVIDIPRGQHPAGMRASLRQAWLRVWPLLAVGLALRLLFLLIGAKIYYGSKQVDIYTNGDSYSYVLSFLNWFNYGHFTFDLTQPDAALGRLPGYPFFYGIHYLIFGPEYVLPALAVTQVVLDTLSIWLIYAITARLVGPTTHAAPFIAAALLALYPFSIIWTPITGTETLGLFLVLLWWATLVLAKPTTRTWVWLGILIATLVYVREFLGICLLVTFLYLALAPYAHKYKAEFAKRWRPVLFVLLGFGACYVWWPVRNYALTGRVVLLKPAAAGYANLREDTQAALAWTLTWTNDVTWSLDQILFAPHPTFPAHVITTPEEHRLIDSLVVLSRTCASSFHVRAMMYAPPTPGRDAKLTLNERRYTGPQRANTLREHNCNDAVSNGFKRLRASYINRHPVRALLEVPLQNLHKIFFKNQLIAAGGVAAAPSVAQRITGALFIYRSVLLLLGVVGAWYFRSVVPLWPALLFTAILFFYMASVFRTMEMRYLLQADVLMLVPAALILAHWLPRRWGRSQQASLHKPARVA